MLVHFRAGSVKGLYHRDVSSVWFYCVLGLGFCLALPFCLGLGFCVMILGWLSSSAGSQPTCPVYSQRKCAACGIVNWYGASGSCVPKVRRRAPARASHSVRKCFVVSSVRSCLHKVHFGSTDGSILDSWYAR